MRLPSYARGGAAIVATATAMALLVSALASDTVVGTPAPTASVPLPWVTPSEPPPPPPSSRPTPTPDPAIWRFEGVVSNEAGEPIPEVCVVIGPRGCQPGSIRTDSDGRYWVDMPQKTNVVYDLYFAKEGYEVVWHRAQPERPTQFNVVLRRR